MLKITTKQCTKCHKIKDFSNYNKAKFGKYGLNAVCKDCRRAYREANKEEISRKSKERYYANREKYAIRMKAYRETHKEEAKIKAHEYYEANKDKLLKQQKQYYEANKDKLLKQHKQYYEANKEHHLTNTKRWRDANKEYVAEWRKQYNKTEKGKIEQVNGSNRRRHRRRAAADGTIPMVMQFPLSKELGELLENQNHKCGLCGCELGITQGDMHLDHIVPLSRGGVHGLSNVWWLCSTCNLRKGTKLISELDTSAIIK